MTLTGIVRITLAAFVLMMFGAATAQADSIYVSIKGRQGIFKGEVVQKGFEGKIAAIKFFYEILSTREAVSGNATGRRLHKPVTITKEWGAASPQIFQAIATNETLPEVIIDFVGVDHKGAMTLSHSIKLTNAVISDITHKTEPIATGGVHHLEDVSFTFQKIELIDVRSNTMAMDSWLTVQ